MSNTQFERILGTHCAPVLLDRKISNLVAMDKEKEKRAETLINCYRKCFRESGIEVEVICSCKLRMQVLFYNRQKLSEYLRTKEVQEILISRGYPAMGTLEEYLDILKRHFADQEDFPHEIGLFLGYPAHDVAGFIRQKGHDFKVCRYWKVYEKVDEALKLFSVYDRCKEFVNSKLDAGYSIFQIMDMKELCA